MPVRQKTFTLFPSVVFLNGSRVVARLPHHAGYFPVYRAMPGGRGDFEHDARSAAPSLGRRVVVLLLTSRIHLKLNDDHVQLAVAMKSKVSSMMSEA